MSVNFVRFLKISFRIKNIFNPKSLKLILNPKDFNLFLGY